MHATQVMNAVLNLHVHTCFAICTCHVSCGTLHLYIKALETQQTNAATDAFWATNEQKETDALERICSCTCACAYIL